MSVGYFYEELSPYGRWIDYPSYGWCWTPSRVASSWRPYMDGHWAYTPYGWTWVSNEPFGWATFHYGRWLFDPAYGWVWVPGTEWAPAWVAWRTDDEWVGWAALPPTAVWSVSVGLRFDSNQVPDQHWCFVPQGRMVDRSLPVATIARNATLLARTRDVTRYDVRENRPANVGLAVGQVERKLGRKVQVLQAVDVDRPERARGRTAGGVSVFRPDIRPAPVGETPSPRARIPSETAVSAAEERRQFDNERRQLEASHARERAKLEQEHRRDMAQARVRGESQDEVRRRHTGERERLDRHASVEKQALEQKWKKRQAKPSKQAQQEEKDKEKEKRNPRQR